MTKDTAAVIVFLFIVGVHTVLGSGRQQEQNDYAFRTFPKWLTTFIRSHFFALFGPVRSYSKLSPSTNFFCFIVSDAVLRRKVCFLAGLSSWRKGKKPGTSMLLGWEHRRRLVCDGLPKRSMSCGTSHCHAMYGLQCSDSLYSDNKIN